MKKSKRISQGAMLYLAVAANRVRPLLDAIVRLETEAWDRISEETRYFPEMEEISEAKHDQLVQAAYEDVLAKARALWRADRSVEIAEDQIQDEFSRLGTK